MTDILRRKEWLLIICVLLVEFYIHGKSTLIVVADSLDHSPLANASVFDNKGNLIGVSDNDGVIRCAASRAFPITLRYLGYSEKYVETPGLDSIFMQESIYQLPEFVVDSKRKKILHILAYVREYSTLSSYSDTITMFREKLVDYMIPAKRKSRYQGWQHPRVLNSRSYYQFTNSQGLDSVSNHCNHHFSWSDWVGILPNMQIPATLNSGAIVSDTINGRYGQIEIWNKNDDRISVDINVLADTIGRKWVPDISFFFNKKNLDFERFRLHTNYENVTGEELFPIDLNSYSFNIESRGRGHNMFRFNQEDQPYYVTTYTEVYMLDKEFISKTEAKKWEDRKIKTEDIEILEPSSAPELQASTLALIERVNNIDTDKLKLATKPDQRLISRNVLKEKFDTGNRALGFLKKIFGISSRK